MAYLVTTFNGLNYHLRLYHEKWWCLDFYSHAAHQLLPTALLVIATASGHFAHVFHLSILLQRVTVSLGHVVSLTGITKVVIVTVNAVILNVWEAAGGTLKTIRLHVSPAGTSTMKESVGVNVRRGMENSCWR